MKEKFSIKERLYSFKYAFDGLKTLIREEHNTRIHLAVSIIAVSMGFLLDINRLEWIALIFAIGLVISMEAINSSIENLADVVSPQKSEQIKKVKDIAAFAVLFSAIASITIGLIIFIPKIF